MGGVTSYTYDAVGNVLSITDPMGFVTSYTYTADNQQATATDAEGHTTSYTYNTLSQVSTVTSPGGNSISYTYDANGNPLTTTDAEGGVVRHEYDALDRLVASTDANGNRQTFEYDNEGNQTKNTDPLDYATSSSYDALGQLVQETDRNGNVRKYTYDADGNMISSTDPLGNVTQYTYDENGNQLSETTPMGLTTSNVYDNMDRVSSTTDPMGHAVTFFYDAAGQLVGMTNKDGTKVAYTYDANGNNLTVTDEEGYVVTYTYDANNRMTAIKNARGYTTSYEYDRVGNLVKTINAMNGVSIVVYDADGNLISETNTDGATTTYTYDGLGRVLTMTDPVGAVTTTEYDANGNVVKLTQADGHSITYTYNARNELTSYVDAEGYTHSFTYDGNGNKTSETNGNGNTTYYTYDGLDRLVGKKDAEGGVSSKTYDADGRLIKVVNEEGTETNYAYDDCGRVVKMTDALGNATTYTYDEMDRVLTITDPRGGVTTYTYTDRGDVATETDAEGYTISYEYDGNHNMVKKTTVDGVTTYEYDPLDRLIKTTTPDGKSETIEYNGEGQVVASTDKGGHKTSYVLDANGNVIETIDALGNSALFEYDLMGNLVKTSLHRVDTQDGVDEWEITLYEYDGRTTTYTYDGMGRTVKMEYPHGWVEDYHYDSIGQLLKVEDTDPSGKDMKQQKHVYEYDDCGNMTYEYMRGNGTGEATVENFYTYDALHRVTNAKENYGNASRTYQYDSLGNLTWETNSNNVTTDYKLNNLNQITEKSSDGWKTHTAFTYDKRGNLIQEQYGKNKKVTSIGTYTYDETNKMVKGVNANAESSSYLYNGLGALVEQTWVIAKNSYGYHDVLAEAVDSVAEEPETASDSVDSPEVPAPSDDSTTETDAVLDEAPADSADSGIMLLAAPKKDDSGKKPSDKPTGSDVKKTSTVVKEFVVDYTTETHEPLMEQEVNGLTYRYVYGNDRLSVNITGVENGSSKLIENGNQIRLYYHMDYLGTADYLTSPQTGKVESWTHYNEWGEITHNAVLKCGQRELDLVKRYATHDFDAVLNQYYAKARFYDAENRHFTAMDPILDPSQYSIKEYVDNPMQLVQYLYVENSPLIYIDPLGKFRNGTVLYKGIRWHSSDIKALQTALNRYASSLGFERLDVDGSFGPKTEIAVNAYKDKYLPGGNTGENRGKVGYSTWLKLNLPIDAPANPIEALPGFPFFFKWNEDEGIWYTPNDEFVAQKPFGYNDVYDFVFQLTDYRYFESRFNYNGMDWMIEGWKGFYLNMGVGAEIGVYYRLPQNSTKNTGYFESAGICIEDAIGHYWVVDEEDMLLMSYKVYDGPVSSGKLIFSRPLQRHWWLNGFRPSIGHIPAEDLTLNGYIYFPADANGSGTMATRFKNGISSTKAGTGSGGRFDNSNFTIHSTTKVYYSSAGSSGWYYKVKFTWGEIKHETTRYRYHAGDRSCFYHLRL